MVNPLIRRYTEFSLWFITSIHFMGFFFLREWMEFSGIGAEAHRLEEKYGLTYIVLLNLVAAIAFAVIAILFQKRKKFMELNLVIMTIFVLRGIGGLLASAVGVTGTASTFWEVVFSLFALSIGAFGILILQEERRCS